MPWSLSQRDGKWCVIKDDDGSEAGCHVTRADAIKQQRALYANESRMASIYEELDAQEIEVIEPVEEVATPAPEKTSLDLLWIGGQLEREKNLIASLTQTMERISMNQAKDLEDRDALVAAISALGQPIINVPPAEVRVDVPPAEVTVTPAITVEAPQVTVQVPEIVPQVTVVSEPSVARSKTVVFERDPLTREVTSAEVTEE